MSKIIDHLNANETPVPPAPAAPAPQREHGFGLLPCPRCGASASMCVRLDMLDGFTCAECWDDFTAANLHALFTAWMPVLGWLATAPDPARMT